MNEIFFLEITEMIETKPFMNDLWMMVQWSFVYSWWVYVDHKSKMGATAGQILKFDPMRKMF
jgi:hypothetical protein